MPKYPQLGWQKFAEYTWKLTMWLTLTRAFFAVILFCLYILFPTRGLNHQKCMKIAKTVFWGQNSARVGHAKLWGGGGGLGISRVFGGGGIYLSISISIYMLYHNRCPCHYSNSPLSYIKSVAHYTFPYHNENQSIFP